jgi:hypothetical protein
MNNGRKGEELAARLEKLKLNLQFQRSRSLSRDLKLLWMTGRYSFFPRGFSRERILRALG